MYVVEPSGSPCSELEESSGRCSPQAGSASDLQPPLSISVTSREVELPPGLELASARNWPATATTLKLEKLGVRLHVDIGWESCGHVEAVTLGLAPQAGARLTLGGAPEDANYWVPLMVTGEQTVCVKPSAASSRQSGSAPRANVLRATCQHVWEEEPQDPDADDEDTVEGSHDDVTSGNGVGDASMCLVGYSMRARINVTATLYLAPGGVLPSETVGGSSSSAPGRRHTMLVSGAGTLELQPRLVDFRKLGLTRLMNVAHEESRRGENAAALRKWRHALPVQERRARQGGSKDGTKLATLLHSMGVAYNMLGDPREALSCLRRALAIRQHVHGEEHPESARTLQALGVVRVRDGEYHEAFEYFWQALTYYEAFEPDSLDAASTLQAIAGVYGKLGEYSEALECYVRALAVREQELGQDHAEVAATLHNLGVVLEKLSDHTEALDSLHRALVIREKRLGSSHPQTARTLHSIGIVYSQVLDYDSALSFYQRALQICQKRPGEGTHAAATLNNMGVVYAKLGHTEFALSHHQQALAIQDRMLGPTHCDTQATRYNLSVLQAEIEQHANKSVFDTMRNFIAMAISPEPESTSLLTLLCEEQREIDGPLDEPFCNAPQCGPGGMCSMKVYPKSLMQEHPPVHVQSELGGFSGPSAEHFVNPNGSVARIGIPEPKRRGRGYPAASDPVGTSSLPVRAPSYQTDAFDGPGVAATSSGKVSL